MLPSDMNTIPVSSFLLLVLSVPVAASAQTSGRVIDPSGMPVPGARVMSLPWEDTRTDADRPIQPRASSRCRSIFKRWLSASNKADGRRKRDHHPQPDTRTRMLSQPHVVAGSRARAVRSLRTLRALRESLCESSKNVSTFFYRKFSRSAASSRLCARGLSAPSRLTIRPLGWILWQTPPVRPELSNRAIRVRRLVRSDLGLP